MISISPGYSPNSIPLSGRHENVIFLDSSGFKIKLFSETIICGEIAPDDLIFVIIGCS